MVEHTSRLADPTSRFTRRTFLEARQRRPRSRPRFTRPNRPSARSSWASSAAAGGGAGLPGCSRSTAATRSTPWPTTSRTPPTAGEALGVDKARRFTGLSGYKQLIDSGVEAIALIDVPYFFAEQAKAAVEAGCHVYMAKPIAVDVPGCLAIEAAGKQATQKKRCFLVDYQLPTEPANIEVANRIREGALGKLAHILSFGLRSVWADPPKGPTIENRLRGEIWLLRHRPGRRQHRLLRHPHHRRHHLGHGQAARQRLRPLAHLPPRTRTATAATAAAWSTSTTTA